MCGFVALMHAQAQEINTEVIQNIKDLTSTLTHRGTDDQGYFLDEYVNLGFKRLSILDIEGGHQPLAFHNNRYWIVFNGEIYNYLELRKELLDKGHEFSTQSDTEVVIALYCEYQEKMVNQLRGMFALLIWDMEEKRLFGARDHFGIKPFYYLERETITYFASEKKGIMKAEHDDLDMDSLQHYLSFQYVPSPDTISKHIKILAPGHYFTKNLNQPMDIRPYWQPKFEPIPTSELATYS